MPTAPPAQVLVHDPMQRDRIPTTELEDDTQHDVWPMVQDARVVAERHRGAIRDHLRAGLREQHTGVKHLLDEHRPLASGGRGEKVQVLPDRTADRARNPDIMLESGPPTRDGLTDERRHDGAALDPQASVVMERELAGGVSYHEAANPAIAHEDVRAKPEEEKRHANRASCGDCICQSVSGGGIVQQVRGPSNLERRIGRHWLVAPQPDGIQPCRERVERVL